MIQNICIALLIALHILGFLGFIVTHGVQKKYVVNGWRNACFALIQSLLWLLACGVIGK